MSGMYTDGIIQTYPGDDASVHTWMTAITNGGPNGVQIKGVTVQFAIADPTIASLTTPATTETVPNGTLGLNGAVATATVHTLKAGTTTLTATAVGVTALNGGKLVATWPIKVVVPTQIVFEPVQLSLARSAASATVYAYLAGADGTVIVGHPLKWSCPAGESVARLFDQGQTTECSFTSGAVKIVPMRLGSTTFHASAGDDILSRYPVSGDLTVTVTPDVARVDLVPAGQFTVAGQTQINPVFRDAQGNVLPSGLSDEYGSVARALRWTIGNSSVATVDQHGLVTGVAVGQTTVTAEYVDPADPTFTRILFSGTTSISVGPQNFGTYQLSVLTAPLNVTQGTSKPDTVTIDRAALGGYTGGVRITGTSDAGISVIAPPTSTTTRQIEFSVQVLGGVGVGTHFVTLTAIADDNIPNVVATFAVVVLAPNNIAYAFCPVTGVPVWVAVQDGGQGAPWTAASGSGGTYGLSIVSGKGGLAYVTQDASGTALHILYGTQAQIQAQGAAGCAGRSGATSSVSGAVSNIGTAARVTLGLGSAQALAGPGSLAFQLTPVEPGTLDLVASSVGGTTPRAPVKMFLRRAFTPGASVGTLDFSGSEAFVPDQAQFALNNTLGQFIAVQYALHTSTNAPLTVYHNDQATVATWQLFGLPGAQMQAGDVHYASARAYTGTGATTEYRDAATMFGAVAPQSVMFGPALLEPLVIPQATTTAYARPQATMTLQPEYNKLYEMAFEQSNAGNEQSVYFQMTSDYAGSFSTVAFVTPDFTNVAGWSNSYGLVKAFLTHWRATGSGWSAGGTFFPAFAAGNTFLSATKQADFTP